MRVARYPTAPYLCVTLLALLVARGPTVQQKKRYAHPAQPEAVETIELIEKAPRNGESPVQRIELIEAVIKH